MYHHHTLFRLAIGKNSGNVTAEESVKKREPSYTDAGNVN